MWSALLWTPFVLCIFCMIPWHLNQMTLKLFLNTIIAATFQSYTGHLDMPTPVFWTLFVFLLPFTLVPMSYGSVSYILVIPHVKMIAMAPNFAPP